MCAGTLNQGASAPLVVGLDPIELPNPEVDMSPPVSHDNLPDYTSDASQCISPGALPSSERDEDEEEVSDKEEQDNEKRELADDPFGFSRPFENYPSDPPRCNALPDLVNPDIVGSNPPSLFPTPYLRPEASLPPRAFPPVQAAEGEVEKASRILVSLGLQPNRFSTGHKTEAEKKPEPEVLGAGYDEEIPYLRLPPVLDDEDEPDLEPPTWRYDAPVVEPAPVPTSAPVFHPATKMVEFFSQEIDKTAKTIKAEMQKTNAEIKYELYEVKCGLYEIKGTIDDGIDEMRDRNAETTNNAYDLEMTVQGYVAEARNSTAEIKAAVDQLKTSIGGDVQRMRNTTTLILDNLHQLEETTRASLREMRITTANVRKEVRVMEGTIQEMRNEMGQLRSGNEELRSLIQVTRDLLHGEMTRMHGAAEPAANSLPVTAPVSDGATAPVTAPETGDDGVGKSASEETAVTAPVSNGATAPGIEARIEGDGVGKSASGEAAAKAPGAQAPKKSASGKATVNELEPILAEFIPWWIWLIVAILLVYNFYYK